MVGQDVYKRQVYAGLEEKLDTKSYKRSIGVYSAPSTVAAALSTETVFAALMKIYDGKLLADYVAENELFAPLGAPGGEAREEAAVQVRELYEKWLGNGSTFRFQYQFQGREGENMDFDGGQTDVFPVRGLVAVYVFITGLYGAVVMCGDEERGLFLPLSYGYRIPCRVASMAAPVSYTHLDVYKRQLSPVSYIGRECKIIIINDSLTIP